MFIDSTNSEVLPSRSIPYECCVHFFRSQLRPCLQREAHLRPECEVPSQLLRSVESANTCYWPEPGSHWCQAIISLTRTRGWRSLQGSGDCPGCSLWPIMWGVDLFSWWCAGTRARDGVGLSWAWCEEWEALRPGVRWGWGAPGHETETRRPGKCAPETQWPRLRRHGSQGQRAHNSSSIDKLVLSHTLYST